VALQSKVWVCGYSLAESVGLNFIRAWMFVSCECCVLSGGGLWNGLITHPEESY
jgi:hypothetical protein